MRGRRILLALALTLVTGTTVPAIAQVERIDLDIAGYLCGF